ncbi:MAG TPA: PQQ-dependent sugar dehydrogenase [Acidimicrobiia bacterium]|nr:PQQ-dependent sugar dehydrogenase [Acidimicrobiia bacterium]
MKWLRAGLVIGLVVLTALPAMATDTVGVVDPTTGSWTLRSENTNSKTIVYGNPGDVPFVGDWNCDGVDTPGLYRRSDGFAYLRNSNTTGVADITFVFGNPDDLPIAGDFDGDGCDTVSIYRPSEARFYVINELGEDGGGLGRAEFSFGFGNPGDIPVSGDWDGDGLDTPGLRRPSDGFVYLRNSNTTGFADISYFYGDPGDLPTAGDWNDDGADTFGLFRPSNGTFFLKNTNRTGVADASFALGTGAALPVAGDFNLNLPPPSPPLALQGVASGLDRPVLVASPPGDPRLFVVEQGGDVEILSGGTALPTPFLDLGVTTGGERGLLGLAFHPNYATNGKFYVNYTINSVSRISEFTVSSNPNLANLGSERVLLQVQQPFTNHNGGMLAFDQNGYLVVAFGDGGSGGDPGNRAENPNNLLGKLLRIDVNTTSSGRQYGIPATNPFAGGGGAPEVYMLGLRNPWRFAIDSGRFYIADVGQGSIEEVTIVSAAAAGANLGWNTWEGTTCFQGPCGTAGFTFPQVEYTHASGCSVTGGFVYRGSAIPGLAGTYFYGDFCAGRIHSFVFEGGIVTKHQDRAGELGVVSQLSSFGYDASGEVYVTSLTGQVFKIVAR